MFTIFTGEVPALSGRAHLESGVGQPASIQHRTLARGQRRVGVPDSGNKACANTVSSSKQSGEHAQTTERAWETTFKEIFVQSKKVVFGDPCADGAYTCAQTHTPYDEVDEVVVVRIPLDGKAVFARSITKRRKISENRDASVLTQKRCRQNARTKHDKECRDITQSPRKACVAVR